MRVVLQDKVFGDEQDRLISVLEELGVQYSIGYPDSIVGDERVFCRGTIDFIEGFNRKFYGYYSPVGDLTLENYQYNVYAKHYLDVLLNSGFSIYPWWYLKNLQPLTRLFVRPLSGRKIFTGTTVGEKFFKKELEIIEGLPSTAGLTDETLVVISTYSEILAEYRLLMNRDTFLGWSEYTETGRWLPHGDLTEILTWFKWFPDEYYTADVALTPEGWKLVELNSLASAGWYDIDPSPVITSMLEKHNDRN
jgi:hypothetical protein